MFKSDQAANRDKVEVDLVLTDGTELRGSFFTTPQERLADTMNDSRCYLPFQFDDGTVKLINKNLIGTVTPLQQDPEKQREENVEKRHSAFAKSGMETEEAYKILGLEPGAKKKDIEEAKKRLLTALHPDIGGSTYLATKINQAVVVLTT